MNMLDLSEYETEVDSPEVAALKKKIVEVAAKYKKLNGWCSEVDRAVREIGVVPPPPVPVVGKVLGLIDFEVSIPAADLIGKTDDQQMRAIVKQVGDMRLTTSSQYVAVTAEMLSEVTVKPKEVEPTVPGTPDGYLWRKLGNGRVNHLFEKGQWEADYGIEPVCRKVYVSSYERSSAELDVTASNCGTCTTRAANL